MSWLDGHSAVVTGAGSGLGRAIVERFVDEGARVVAFDKSQQKLEELKDKLGDAVEIVAGDVRSSSDNERACALAVTSFGKLDTFVGNAGLWDFNRSLPDTPVEQLESGFDELFGVNVKGYLLGVKAALSALRESRGSVVLTLSNAAFFPAGGGPLYVASKHAGVGLVKQLAYELAPDVRVNAVAPGGMDTDLRGPAALGLSDTAIGEAIPINDLMAQGSALRFAPQPADYVGAYLLLAAKSQSATVTGSVFDISSFGILPRYAG
ncbi:NAD(P)-dependent dehydrogenase (short-subunit alcohol dehydrogenase family) [Kibdelosporangium banguiense]|uniref:NAD(P)-dependent dehydrogenase (Short-subunit alcohol dehydrogenase family) n=1 Tax=Kibdelosporangium banguiense TaxID=1365924 RepID=A0ABS4T7Y2_9PSEU|nr:3-(cis-5,6-dihydroxycyclohexa-1,3-dien-1-yl)propanoate dehydrogenase [Kibdelosporangium banguiense]MBP2320421.1 NAD(P)-dependent dehydrogenase (short-subunit alcohol dehydrogenase family) [Kibdelosporangium banguiense]